MTKNNKKGFTIIEVVLVLAIAGLIFLMVFIALPALQRSQRNTRRRQDMARILTAFNDYQANNNGKMPQADSAGKKELAMLVNRYITGIKDYALDNGDNIGSLKECKNSDQFCDPDGTSYNFAVRAAISGDVENINDHIKNDGKDYSHSIFYYVHAKCGDTEGSIKNGSGNNDIAIFYKLEGGAWYCGDNQ